MKIPSGTDQLWKEFAYRGQIPSGTDQLWKEFVYSVQILSGTGQLWKEFTYNVQFQIKARPKCPALSEIPVTSPVTSVYT